MSDEYDYLFKCICVGDGGCGKTALVVRFSQGFFQEQYKLTIGVEFAVKTIELVNTKKVKLQIWDTGGQERFQYVRPMYYRGAMGAIILFDLSNRESFEHLPKWIEEVSSNVGDLPMLIVGNKSDLVNERKVTRAEAENFTREFKSYYIESSAKNGTGVGDVFAILSYLMIGLDVPNEYLAETAVVDTFKEEIADIPLAESDTPEPTFFNTANKVNLDIPKVEPIKIPEVVKFDQPPVTNEPVIPNYQQNIPSPQNFDQISNENLNIPPIPRKQVVKQPEPTNWSIPEIPTPSPKPEPEPVNWSIPEIPSPSPEPVGKIEPVSYSQQNIPSQNEIDKSIPDIPQRSEQTTSIQGPITFDDSDQNFEELDQPTSKQSTPLPLVFETPDEILFEDSSPDSDIIDTTEKVSPGEENKWGFLSQQPKAEPKIIVPAPVGRNKNPFSFPNATPAAPPPTFKKPEIFPKKDPILKPQSKKKRHSSNVLFGDVVSEKKPKTDSVGSFLGALGTNKTSTPKSKPMQSFMAFTEKPSQEKSKPSFFVPEIQTKTKSKSLQFSDLTPIPETKKDKRKAKKAKKGEKKKNIVICKTCAALLNSSYKFCNKCGSRL